MANATLNSAFTVGSSRKLLRVQIRIIRTAKDTSNALVTVNALVNIGFQSSPTRRRLSGIRN